MKCCNFHHNEHICVHTGKTDTDIWSGNVKDRKEKHICSNIGVELKCPQHRRWPSVIFRINADTRQHQSFVDTLSQSGPITNIVSQWQHNIQLHTTLEHSVAKGYCSIYLGPVVRWPGVKICFM